MIIIVTPLQQTFKDINATFVADKWSCYIFFIEM